ncbi:asparagine synthase (glutamine-hydrolyzing) [Camelliibacillus cellulosilyticus]|uniref:asparagine synthase (glutamine-hydrolyzing) n=1 Tax=Camelliibacillus cellulosilyticus TaxID=2174486 RepID=A0ABV9GQZ3_9BACL
MCGIIGWVDGKRDLRSERPIIEQMTNCLKHRGPDEQALWTTPQVAFGHARLIVVDPSGGKQPMHKDRDGQTFTIVYNGELYNTEDIRAELMLKGYTFKGHSDTEVLLSAYIEWGEACVDRLNGIFAFAIWDGGRRQLFMGRDRLGVKPLFYHVGGDYLIFGSEIKALLKHPYIKPAITREGLSEVIGLGPSKTPGSGIYKGIHELRPAHILTFSFEKGLNIRRYWNVQSDHHTDDIAETVLKVRDLIIDAVKRQMYADVPVATFLSGGIDSSGISAIGSRYLITRGAGPLQTFSIDYEDNDKYFKKSSFQPNSDRDFVHLVSEHIGSDHHALIIPTDILVDQLRQAILFRDTPGYADIDASLLWFCGKMKKDATVALSGECADEIFGGYPWFHHPETSTKEGFPWIRSIDWRQSLLNDKWHQRLHLKEYAMERFQETIKETPRLDGETDLDAKRRALFYLNMTWFMTALLDRKDRMSMGASMEVRVPFADHRLVEYVWNIPWEIKMMNGHEKGVLRQAFEGFLPDIILYRKKSPYPKTHHPTYTKKVSAWLNDIIKQPSAPLLELFNKKKLKDMIETSGRSFQIPWFGQLMSGPQLIAHLAQINVWLETYHVNIEDR